MCKICDGCIVYLGRTQEAERLRAAGKEGKIPTTSKNIPARILEAVVTQAVASRIFLENMLAGLTGRAATSVGVYNLF